MVEGADPKLVRSKCKAISTVLPYSVFLEQGGRPEMLDAVIDASRASNSFRPIWGHAQPYLRSLLSRTNHPSLHRAIMLTSPHLDWDSELCDESMVSRWVRSVAATSAAAYTEAVGQSVVDTLLQIASINHLRPHIPVDIWTWLKKQPTLPPVCRGRFLGTGFGIFHQIRGLGDIEIVKSYFLLVWSEWDYLGSGLNEMEIAFSEDFGGIRMWCHRQDLIERLDYILGQLELGWEILHRNNPFVDGGDVETSKRQYGRLNETLLEVDRQAMDTLTRTSPKLTHLNKRPNSRGC